MKLLVFLVLICLAFCVHARVPVPFQNKSHSLVAALWDVQTPDKILDKYVQRYKSVGFKHITIPIFGCQSHAKSSDVGACVYQDVSFPLRVANRVKAAGLQVSFLPIVGAKSNEWRGIFDPTNSREWFENYEKWIKSIAQIAVDFDSPEFVAATEFGPLYRYTENWKRVFVEVRKIFKRPLIATFNWNHEPEALFLDEVDAIGVSAYHPLADESVKPTPQSLLAKARFHRDGLLKLSQKFRRPIHITELGYASTATGVIKPWVGYVAGDFMDVNLQAEAIGAVLKAWAGQPSLVHIGFWGTSDWADLTAPLNYEILDKPAEKVIQKFLAAPR